MLNRITEMLMPCIGAGRILHYGMQSEALVVALLRRGGDAYGLRYRAAAAAPALALTARCRDGDLILDMAALSPFDTIIVDADVMAVTEPEVLERMGPVLYRATRRYLVMMPTYDIVGLSPERATMAFWRQWALRHGFRLGSPRSRLVPLDDEGGSLPPFFIFERVPETALALWQDAQDFDIMRSVSAAAKATYLRYAALCDWVRSRDTVLDCACDGGGGLSVLAAQGKAKRFIGLTQDADRVVYGGLVYGDAYGIGFFENAQPESGNIVPASIDFMIAFDVPMEGEDSLSAFLAHVKLMLKPDGRLVMGFGAARRDLSAQLAQALPEGFIVEARYVQHTASPVEVPLDAPADDAAVFCFFVASNRPADGPAIAYHHPNFSDSVSGAGCWVGDMGSYYDNPWIYRSLIQGGERLKDDAVLLRELQRILPDTRPKSADRGAVLTAIGYQLIEQNTVDGFDAIAAQLEAYLAFSSLNPHVRRWQISARYLLGLFAVGRGLWGRADHWFGAVVASDVTVFSPLLASKTVGACLWRGLIALLDRNDVIQAAAHFKQGIAEAERSIKADWTNVLGREDKPFIFGMIELAQIANIAEQCVMALDRLEQYRTAPGAFWEAVNVTRIGIDNWIQHLVRENDILRNALARDRGI